MIKRLKRPLSGLLALCLMVSTLPSTIVSAGAAGNEIYVSQSGDNRNSGSFDDPLASVNAAYATAEDGDTIVLLDAIESDTPITMLDNKTITLRGDAGASLTYTGATPLHSGSEAFLMLQSGSLMIEDLHIGLPEAYGTNGRVLMVENADAMLANGAVLENGYLAYGGGGVRIGSGGSLLLQDGAVIQRCFVANNTSEYGGGVQVMAGGSLTMEGGEITNNTIHTTQGYESYGGGVAIMAGGHMTASGGTIGGNTVDTAGGGLYIAPGADVDISGSFSVSGNIAGDRDSNLYLPSKNNFTVSGTVTGSIGITCGDPDYEDIVGAPNGNEIAADDEAAFEYDDGTYDIRLKNKNLVLWKHTVKVDFNGTGVENENTDLETPVGEDYDAILKPADGVDLPDEIDVTVGGKILAHETDYTYDPETGDLHIPGTQVTGKIEISATGNGLYTITVTAVNVQADIESAIVTQQATTAITLSKSPKYALPETVQVSGACDYDYLDGIITISNVTENIAVTAEGVDIHHTITFDPNEGTCDTAEKDIVESQDKFGELPLPLRDGYTFVGWFDEFDNRITADTVNNLSTDLALTAKWSKDTNIAYAVQHWTELVDSGLNPGYEAGVTAVQAVGEKQYYLFQKDAYNDGISDTALDLHPYLLTAFGALDVKGITPNSDNQYTVTVLPDGSSIFNLYYHREIYKVSFDPNGGNNLKPGDTVASVKYGSYYAVMPQATRSGYTLIGWFADNGEQRKSGDVCQTVGDHVLYAHWQSDGDTKYQVRHLLQPLHDNLPETDRARYVPYQTSDLKGTSDKTVDIYALAVKGFKPCKDNPSTIHVKADGTAIEMLYYDRLPVTIHYDAAGGSSVGIEHTIYYGGTISSLPDLPSRTGYICDGWYNGQSAADKKIALGDDINVLNPELKPNITFCAHWTARTYDVPLVVTGGTSSGSLTITYDKPVGTMPTTTKTGYTFTGWALADGTLITADSLVSTDTLIDIVNGAEQAKTLYAQYTANQYTLTFDPAGGTLDDNTMTVTYNEQYGILPIVKKSGYVFDRWTFADGSALNADDVCKLTENTTVYATYFAKHLNISFDVNGGSASLNKLIVEYGKPFGALPTTSRNGYTFSGWYTDKTAGTQITPDTIVTLTEDTTLYAHWTPSGGGGSGGGGGGTAAPTTYSITATADNGAEISPTGKVSVTAGSDQTFEIRIKLGFSLKAITVDGQVIKSVDAYTFKAIASDHTITVSTISLGDSILRSDHIAYVSGYADGTIRPDAEITRAEVAQIFYRLLSDSSRKQFSDAICQYSDATNKWYTGAVSTLSAAGILNGYSDGTFRPDNKITRAEFAAVAARFDSSAYTDGNMFNDIAGHWAANSINRAASRGWVGGYPDGSFGPDLYITRAETMTLVNRVLNRTPETSDDLLANMKTWPDNADPTKWYYIAIQEATNTHDFEIKNDRFEKWVRLDSDVDSES